MWLWPILDSYVKVYKTSEEFLVPVLHGNAVDTGRFSHYEEMQAC